MISIGRLGAADRPEWETLFAGYNSFYERTLQPEMFDRAWTPFQEDTRMHALGAKLDGSLVGITQRKRGVPDANESRGDHSIGRGAGGSPGRVQGRQ